MKYRLLLPFIIVLSIIRVETAAQNFQADFSEKYGMLSGVINSVPVGDGWLMIKKSFDKRNFTRM